MKLYHFCAVAQTSTGVLQYADGIIEYDLDTSNKQSYEELKNNIKEFMEVKVVITILSLSVLEVK